MAKADKLIGGVLSAFVLGTIVLVLITETGGMILRELSGITGPFLGPVLGTILALLAFVGMFIAVLKGTMEMV